MAFEPVFLLVQLFDDAAPEIPLFFGLPQGLEVPSQAVLVAEDRLLFVLQIFQLPFQLGNLRPQREVICSRKNAFCRQSVSAEGGKQSRLPDALHETVLRPPCRFLGYLELRLLRFLSLRLQLHLEAVIVRCFLSRIGGIDQLPLGLLPGMFDDDGLRLVLKVLKGISLCLTELEMARQDSVSNGYPVNLLGVLTSLGIHPRAQVDCVGNISLLVRLERADERLTGVGVLLRSP